jgi:hypothetical protein
LQAADAAPEYERLWRQALGLAADGSVLARYSPLERVLDATSRRLLESTPRNHVRAALTSGGALDSRLRAAQWLAIAQRPGRPASSLVVKSVYAVLSAEWIARRFPVRIAVILRAPLRVLSSWAKLDWLGRPGDDMLDLVGRDAREQLAARWSVPPPPPGTSVVARAAWMIGAFTCDLVHAAGRNPTWRSVTHEDLCAAPHERFRELAGALELDWGGEVDRLLDDMNRPGGAFEPFRVRDELRDEWRTRLRPEQVGEALAVLARFPPYPSLLRPPPVRRTPKR